MIFRFRRMRSLVGLVGLFTASVGLADTPRYFMTMFASQATPNAASASHTFATFVSLDDGAITSEHTISWLPAPGYFGPRNTMPRVSRVPGRNYSLNDTLALSAGRAVSYWGPYEINAELFARVLTRIAMLNLERTQYKMIVTDDNLRSPSLANQPGGAINCIMGVSDLGGYLDTGSAWGTAASQQVLNFLKTFVISTEPNHEVEHAMGLPERILLH